MRRLSFKLVFESDLEMLPIGQERDSVQECTAFMVSLVYPIWQSSPPSNYVSRRLESGLR